MELPDAEQHKQLIDGSGKILLLRLLLPKLKQRGHRILLFSQVGRLCSSQCILNLGTVQDRFG